jgi:hypothetical protein
MVLKTLCPLERRKIVHEPTIFAVRDLLVRRDAPYAACFPNAVRVAFGK